MAVLLRIQPRDWLTFTATPTGVSATEPATNGIAVGSRGLTDIPFTVELSRAFDVLLSPAVGMAYTITAPVGDTASGFGTGSPGQSASVSLGAAPLPGFGVRAGVGRSLSGFSVRSSFSADAALWGDVDVSASIADRLQVEAGYSSDLGAIDTTYGRGRSILGAATIRVAGPIALTFTASHGITGATPAWSFAFGLGTAFALPGSTARGQSVADQLADTFGGGRHGLPADAVPGSSPGASALAPGHGGTNPGQSGGKGQGSTHGKGRSKQG